MVAEVIVDISAASVDKVFDYTALEDTMLGQRVLVPFGKNVIEGFVISLKSDSDYGKPLKSIIRALDKAPAVSEELLTLMREFSVENNLKYIDLLRLFIPAQMRGGKVSPLIKNYVRLTEGLDFEDAMNSLSPRAYRQRDCLEALKESGERGILRPELAGVFGASAVDALIEKGILTLFTKQSLRAPNAMELKAVRHKLTPAQQNAADTITNGNDAYLLHGVTGSGKTEVYMTVIERAVSLGKTAIMLVPEISLTPQIFGVFRARFGDKVAILHSGLSAGERYDEWRRLLFGDAVIAVGARSAIFAPLKNLGVIIIDEEHDGSYLSEGNPRYDTREIALFRAKYNGCPLVLGSATPSAESYYKTQTGEYKLLQLPERVNKKNMPKMSVVNMSAELKRGNRDIFSAELKDAIQQTLDEKNQAMVFINSRGYASFVMCRECGYVAKCEDCDVSLTYHKEDGQLKCHYCGRRYKALSRCPVCGSEKLRQGRVGTERVVSELQTLFPSARILRMDSDNTSTKDAVLNILQKFANREADILVGTQIIAKGHDFENVTLVGILDADFSLYFSDFRSSERTFQLITQVAGRAGRAEKSGRVIIQTFAPKHYVFRFASNYDYLGFYNKEINTREVTKFPPFSVIVRVLVTAVDEPVAMDTARGIHMAMKGLIEKYRADFIYYKAMKAPLTRIKNRYRYQLLMRLAPQNAQNVLKNIYEICNNYKQTKDCWVFVESNPQSLV